MTPSGTIEVSWIGLDDAEAQTTDWTALVARTGADVWFSPTWVATWGRHYGAERKIVLLSAHQDGNLIAMLPFVFDTVWPSGFPVRLAQLAGPHPLFAVLTMPIEDHLVEEVISIALRDLLSIHRRDCVSLSPISEMYGLPARLQGAIVQMSDAVAHPDTCPRVHTVVPLPESFDAYLARLSSGRRKKYRKTKRDLEQKHNVMTRIVSGPDIVPMLGKFVEMHTHQWKHKGRLGHFADWPGSTNFYADFCRHDDGVARLYLQETNHGAIVSALFCFVTQKSCLALIPARDENWSDPRLHIGMHAQFERFEHLISEGVPLLETGAGEYDYKASLKGELRTMHRLLVCRDTARGKFTMKLLRLHANLLDLIYYRVWYNRIAPKLRKAGLNPGPLWQSWTRSRV